MSKKNKKNNSSVLPIILGGGLLYALSSRKNNKVEITPNNDNYREVLKNFSELSELELFKSNNGVSNVTSNVIVPFYVPSSFQIKSIPNMFQLESGEGYKNGSQISFQIGIYVPETALGYVTIEQAEIENFKLIVYLDNNHNSYINFTTDLDDNGKNLYSENILSSIIGERLYTGFNYFTVNINLGMYFDSGIYPLDVFREILPLNQYEYEGIYFNLKLKVSDCSVANWTVASSWNYPTNNFDLTMYYNRLMFGYNYGTIYGINENERLARNGYQMQIQLMESLAPTRILTKSCNRTYIGKSYYVDNYGI